MIKAGLPGCSLGLAGSFRSAVIVLLLLQTERHERTGHPLNRLEQNPKLLTFKLNVRGRYPAPALSSCFFRVFGARDLQVQPIQ